MHAEIVTTGTELLLGMISDTNSTYIARKLREIGLNLYFITSAGDNQERVAQVIRTALERSDVVITTGGLGPTVGDITREAVAQATGRQLVHDPHLLASIEAFFQRRGYPMSENNRRQARIPEGAIPLENPVGTAPCFIVEDPRGIVISLPGVPREMEYMMEHAVLPYLRARLDLKQVIQTRILKTAAVGESTLDARIADLEQSTNPTIGLAAHPGQVDIRITAKADDLAQADAMLSATEAQVRERVGEHIYGVNDDTLESAVIGALEQCRLTLAVAEVNTSGLSSGWLNRADPAGRVFRGGWVLPGTYAGKAGRGPDLRQEALELAQGVRSADQADVGLAVVNSGPDETCLLVVHGDRAYEQSMRFRGHDAHAQQWVVAYALNLVRQLCLQVAGDPSAGEMETRPADAASTENRPTKA